MKPHGQTADLKSLDAAELRRIFWTRAVLLGLLVWLIPFLAALAVFPLKESWRSLFESIMPLTLAATVVGCTFWYLRRPGDFRFREGILVGLIWLWRRSGEFDNDSFSGWLNSPLLYIGCGLYYVW